MFLQITQNSWCKKEINERINKWWSQKKKKKKNRIRPSYFRCLIQILHLDSFYFSNIRWTIISDKQMYERIENTLDPAHSGNLWLRKLFWIGAPIFENVERFLHNFSHLKSS